MGADSDAYHRGCGASGPWWAAPRWTFALVQTSRKRPAAGRFELRLSASTVIGRLNLLCRNVVKTDKGKMRPVRCPVGHVVRT